MTVTKTKLDPAAITPETILAAAERAGLALVPGEYVVCNTVTGKPVSCCAAGALAIAHCPTIRGEFSISCELRDLIGDEMRIGLVIGFDGLEPLESCRGVPDYDHGYSVGRAVRSRLGLDAGATS
jgi:hypothetical protein